MASSVGERSTPEILVHPGTGRADKHTPTNRQALLLPSKIPDGLGADLLVVAAVLLFFLFLCICDFARRLAF